MEDARQAAAETDSRADDLFEEPEGRIYGTGKCPDETASAVEPAEGGAGND